MNYKRLLMGFGLAPAAGALAVTLMFLGALDFPPVFKLSGLLMVFAMALAFSYVSALLFGAPLIYLLNTAGQTQWPAYLLMGLLSAFLIVLLLCLALQTSPKAMLELWQLPAVGGAVGGLAFWAIAVRQGVAQAGTP